MLSEQVFNGAGRISTKERTSLGSGTIEKLVYLQRTMTKGDALKVTAEGYKVARRDVLTVRKNKARAKAYKEAIEEL